MTAPQQPQISRVFDAVIGGRRTSVEIREIVGLGKCQVSRALNTLWRDGMIERDPQAAPASGNGRRAYRYRPTVR